MEKLKGYYANLMEAYENYKPDMSYALTDQDTLEEMEQIAGLDPKTTGEYREGIRGLLDFLYSWFPDEEEEDVQEELRSLIAHAEQEWTGTAIDEFREAVQSASETLTVKCGVLADAITPALIKLTAFGDPNRSLSAKEEKVLGEVVPAVHTVYPSVTAEDLYIKEAIGEYEELYDVELEPSARKKAYDAVQSFISEHVQDIVTEAVS